MQARACLPDVSASVVDVAEVLDADGVVAADDDVIE